MKEAFRIAMVNINLEGEYEDCCTLYTNEEEAKYICSDKALELIMLDYSVKKFEGNPWQFAKICHQNITFKILYECDNKNGKKQYIGYTTYILK